MIYSIIRGIILNPFGFYISILPNGLSPLSLIAMRTHLSKIISEGEAGKYFHFDYSIKSYDFRYDLTEFNEFHDNSNNKTLITLYINNIVNLLIC